MNELKSILLAIWILFISYALFLAPINEGDYSFLNQMFSLQYTDPLLISVFTLLGIWPIVYCILLLENDRASIKAWPFALGSFVLGAFSLLPYFVFHIEKRRVKNRTPKQVQAILSNRGLYILLLLLTILVMAFGIYFGNVQVYAQAFMQSRFVHVMTIDFAVLTLLSMLGIAHHAYYLHERSKRLWWLGIIPIIGALLYLLITDARQREAEE
ncbi:hypothetical protein GLW08_14140 [Pontibacillus yanchengensis]|uniref:Uncharacterized protein n=2 Tax=Pontibacillus yanchengensis TaxID=462910 RepID=A0ACC7VHQ7_9BACI|nr:hypothetical protein [Pontibacillus yanchengensis]MYL34605.1 hypothetical protein [Pontibacillus yanchengensis]MYL54471.1 hypothetical protein [Pontibacillus yanchengensis]